MITPSIRQDLQLLPGTPMEDGSPSWLIYDNLRNKYFTLGLNAFRILRHWIAGVDSKQFIEKVEAKGVSIEEEELDDFINFLKVNSLITHSSSEDVKLLLAQHQAKKKHWFLSLIHNYLFFKIPLIKPDPFLDRTIDIAKFFGKKLFRSIIYFFGIIGIYFVIQSWDEFLSTFLYFFNFNGLIFYAIALVGVKAIHELGHAYTAKNFGCNVNSMGIAFLVFFPFLYTDNTNAWRLRDHKKRLTINFAGISTELHLALLATFVWGVSDPGILKSAAFFVATTGWISSLLINISPFMRFDGYYVFADFIKIDNLQPRAFAIAKWKLRNWLFGLSLSPPEHMSQQRQNLITIYAWSTWIYRFFLFIGIALLVYFFAFKILGIFLFVVEIIWFIALPILKELREWWKLRSSFFLNIRIIRTILILGALSFILFYPWKNTQSIPAIYQSEEYITIYPTINSQVSDIYIKENQSVQLGADLIKLNSPSLNSDIQKLLEEKKLISIQINNALEGDQNKSDLMIMKSEEKKIITNINNLEKIKSSLNITAPFKGEIVSLIELKKNQWLNKDDPIMSIVNKESFQVIAFLSENDISKVKEFKNSFFVPNSIEMPRVALEVVSISKSPVDDFSLYPSVTSIFNGPIAAREKPGGGIQSEKSYYKVTLKLSENIIFSDKKVLGVANVGIQPQSYFDKILNLISATLIREISF